MAAVGMLMAGLVAAPGWAKPLLPEEAVRKALEFAPELKRAHSLTEAAQAYSRGAGAQPNPMLQLSATAGDRSEDANALAQRLEIAGQPGLRRRVARELAKAREASEEALRREVAMAAGNAYYSLWEKTALLTLAQRQLSLARELEGIATNRLRLGEISVSEHLRVKLFRVQKEANFTQAEGEQSLSHQTLAFLIGEETDVIELPPSSDALPSAPDLELSTSEDEVRPELEAASRLSAASKLEADLAGRAGAPDLQLRAYRSTLGRPAEQGIQLSVIIPLFDWGRLGAIAAQKEKLAEARNYELDMVQRKVQVEFGSAKTKYEVSSRKRQTLSEQASQYFELSKMAQQGYDIGLLSLLEVLDAQTAFHQGLQAYIEAEADYHRCRIRYWWSAGRPILDDDLEDILPGSPNRDQP
jgi:outer membrane protein TolC